MALKPLVSSTTFYKAGKTFEEGMTLKGYYQRTKENEYGPTHYFISKEDDSQYGINGTARLNGLIEKAVRPGVYTEITYEGKKKSKKGKDVHSFWVAIDEEDTKTQEQQDPSAVAEEAEPKMSANDIPL